MLGWFSGLYGDQIKWGWKCEKRPFAQCGNSFHLLLQLSVLHLFFFFSSYLRNLKKGVDQRAPSSPYCIADHALVSSLDIRQCSVEGSVYYNSGRSYTLYTWFLSWPGKSPDITTSVRELYFIKMIKTWFKINILIWNKRWLETRDFEDNYLLFP